MTTTIHNLGFPSIGHRRELKMAVEAYWKGASSQDELMDIAKTLNAKHWQLQKDQGLDLVPVYDFSFYDRMLDTICLLGAAPSRFGFGERVGIDGYFGMARGLDNQPALEMTKWFDTNYHYIVPEFSQGQTFVPQAMPLFYSIEHAKTLMDAKQVKPVLIGPLTFLYLGKEKSDNFDRLSLLEPVLKAYETILTQLKENGVEWVQIDEPVLTLDLPKEWLSKLKPAYEALSKNAPKILLATYFESVADLATELKALPVAGLHLDLVRAPQQLDAFLNSYPADKVLSLGLVDGRNIWRTDLPQTLTTLEKAKAVLKERLWLAPSCSLLHVPVDLAQEQKLDTQLKSWLAFGVQRLEELAVLKKGLDQGRNAIKSELEANQRVMQDRSSSPRIHNTLVQERIAKLDQVSDKRLSEFTTRQKSQRAVLNLPAFPTTTIGSFPQTKAIREARAAFKKGQKSKPEYDEAMRTEIKQAIAKQESLGLDVLVHGEAERNDMVEYFGEQLAGFAFTQAGWVQSYGSRCVKPPVIFGDVYRPTPMTVEWISYAQQQSKKPVKGMLTGPVTILQWSFYRNDQTREKTAYQIALAIRDEVQDLEEAGIKVIQIDEPAYREGLPLKRKDWDAYLNWASRAFRLSSCSAKDETQIHTHMCYSEFNDIFPGIVSMDADVITIEASRSDLELLKGFKSFNYPNEIGPGVYDVHSPAVPTVESMVAMLKTASSVLSPEQLWVNPDCGLKTRGWEEVEAALKNMVSAAKTMQKETAGNLVNKA
jgi:5-methyltetrahydropteroyltriglutamate--homocysteine methyltransferase